MAADTAMFYGDGLRTRHREKIRRFDPPSSRPFLFGYTGMVIYDRFLDDLVLDESYGETTGEVLRRIQSELEAWAMKRGHGETQEGIWQVPAFMALAVDSAGHIYEITPGAVDLIRGRDYAATGAGGQLALGALAAGATPAEAVKIACEHHTQCHVFGDGPQEMWIGEEDGV